MSADLAALFPLDRALPEPRRFWAPAEIAPVLWDLQRRGVLMLGRLAADLPAHGWAVSAGGCLVGWGRRRGCVTTLTALLGVAPSPDAARKAAAEITAWCEARQ